MGWIVVFVLHLFCGMAAMAGVHSQASSEYLYQQFEGDAVRSIMESWVYTGTNSSWLTDTMGWSFTEHPCDNIPVWFKGIYCRQRAFQQNVNTSEIKYYFLDTIELDIDWLGVDYSSKLLGGLPPAILELTNLQTFKIPDAIKLSGTLLPGILCDLENLKTLVLRNCSFSGSISSGFDSTKYILCDANGGIEHLDLSWNSFTSFGSVRFMKAQYLNVSNNQLQGEVWFEDRSIETVDLSNNHITDISFFIFSETTNSNTFKSLHARNNSIMRFPIELFQSKSLRDINLDFNNISSIPISNISISTIQKISLRNNKFQLFPELLLQLSTLEEIFLDSNRITGELHLPNISCQNSKIKLISLLFNNITSFYPSDDFSSCFSKSRILSDNKLFLGGNPICTNPSLKIRLSPQVSQVVCRNDASSLMEELSIGKKKSKTLLVVIVSTSLVVVFAFIVAFFVIQRLKKKISILREFQNELDKKDVKPNLYSFNELRVATQDFHSRNELGRGGFGIVYKGVFPDGSHVAVKKLTKLSIEQGIQDFLGEIITVSNIKHRNLVQLKGCCIKENQRILVHEFVENKNLADALWGDSRSNKHLDWPTRFNIILGIAQGLAYLHEEVEPAIIHRDIKGENILLDKHFNPKIADFGLALFFPSFDDGETHMNVSKVAGTMGYMAPEYLCYGQVSSKLDVFSFGILLLEIVSGRRNIDLKSPSTEQYLVQWVGELFANENLSNLRDKSLEEMTSREATTFEQVVKVGLQCLHHIATRRPPMSKVVAMLIGNKVVDDCELEDYDEGLTSSYVAESSRCHFSTPNSSLQCLSKDGRNMVLDFESHNQSLQLSEIKLVSK